MIISSPWEVKPPPGWPANPYVPEARSLVSWWPLVEGTGTTTRDIAQGGGAATGNPLVFGSTPTWGVGSDGPVVTMPGGSGQSRLVSTNGIFDPSATDFTYALWFLSTVSGSAYYIGSQVGGDNWLIVHVAGDLACPIGTGISGGGSVTTNVWHLAVLTFQGTLGTIYLDGVKVGSGSPTRISATGALRAGTNTSGGAPLTGQISQVMLWSRALAAAEVRQLYGDPRLLWMPRRQRAFGVAAAGGATILGVGDQGTGLILPALAASLAGLDLGAGAAGTATLATLPAADPGAGAEAPGLATTLSPAETGTGAEAAETTAVNTASDAGAGGEAGATAVISTASDAGAGAEAAQTAVLWTASDGGVGTEGAQPSTTWAVHDAGAGTEAAQTAVLWTASDAGAAAEGAAVALLITALEAGSGSDAATLFGQLFAASDLGTGLDGGAIAATLTGLEFGTGGDAALAALILIAAETGTGVAGTSLGTVVLATAPDLLSAIAQAYADEAPSAIPFNTVRVGMVKGEPYALLTMEQTPTVLMRTSTDIFSEVRLNLKVYAGTLAAAADPAETIAEWLDEHVFSFTTAGRAIVAGPFHRSEPTAKALKGRGRDGVQLYQEHTFRGAVIRPRKAPTT